MLLALVLGGMYDSEQSVSSSRVALRRLVTVKGIQVKSGGSSDLVVFVIVIIIVVLIVESTVVVAISVLTGWHDSVEYEVEYTAETDRHWVSP